MPCSSPQRLFPPRTACPWPDGDGSAILVRTEYRLVPRRGTPGHARPHRPGPGLWRSLASDTLRALAEAKGRIGAAGGARSRIGFGGAALCAASTPPRRRTQSCPVPRGLNRLSGPMRHDPNPAWRCSLRPRPAAALSLIWTVARDRHRAPGRCWASSLGPGAAQPMPVAGLAPSGNASTAAWSRWSMGTSSPAHALSPAPDFVLQPRARWSRARPRDRRAPLARACSRPLLPGLAVSPRHARWLRSFIRGVRPSLAGESRQTHPRRQGVTFSRLQI